MLESAQCVLQACFLVPRITRCFRCNTDCYNHFPPSLRACTNVTCAHFLEDEINNEPAVRAGLKHTAGYTYTKPSESETTQMRPSWRRRKPPQIFTTLSCEAGGSYTWHTRHVNDVPDHVITVVSTKPRGHRKHLQVPA